MESDDVLPDGRVGRRAASHHLHSHGGNDPGETSRLAAGRPGRCRHLSRLSGGGGIRGPARTAVQLAHSVAAWPADRSAHHFSKPVYSRITAASLQCRTEERGTGGPCEVCRRDGAERAGSILSGYGAAKG